MYVIWGRFFQGTHHVSLWERLGIRFPQIKNQISTNQNSELDIDVTRVVGCRPGESRGSHLLDPEARQTDSTSCKKLAHRLISCIRSPASAACNSSWGRKKSGHRSKDTSMPVQQNCGKNPVSLLRVKAFEAKAVVQSTRWEETRQNL